MSTSFTTNTTTVTNTSTAEELTLRLDALLATYLQTLDAYTTLRSQLSTHFSDGFFSLASANRNAASVLGPGRRFGEEAFDGRMKAGCRVEMKEREVRARGLEEVGAELEAEISGREAADEKGKEEAHSVPETKMTRDKESEAVDEEDTTTNDDTTTPYPTTPTDDDPPPYPPLPTTTFHLPTPSLSTDTDPKPKNPLSWYTALPPPSLRQTQAHFTSSLPVIASLVSTIAELTALEDAVRELRQELASSSESEGGLLGEEVEKGVAELGLGHEAVREDAGGVDREEDGDGEDLGSKGASSPSSSSSKARNQLASRSSGNHAVGSVRSRVLKMK